METEDRLKTRDSSKSILMVAIVVSLIDFYLLKDFLMALILAFDINPTSVVVMYHVLLFSYSAFRLGNNFSKTGYVIFKYLGVVGMGILAGFCIASIYIVIWIVLIIVTTVNSRFIFKCFTI